MRTIEILNPGVMRMTEREKPQPEEGEILLKIKYVGFCGSDLSTFSGKNPLVSYPRIPGHEISAVIEETGNSVPEKFKPGQSATVIPYTNCGHCSACKQKKYNACRYNQTLGVQRDGAMTEYISLPWQKVIVEQELSGIQLALVEPLTVGFHAVDNIGITDIDTVVVFGCGMIGSGAILRAHLRGATVIAVDIDDSKLEVARKLGAKFQINTKTQNIHKELNKITEENGPSVAIEAAGNPVTYKSAIEEVGFAGRVVCIGYAKEDILSPTKLWVQKELEIRGSRNANPADFDAVIKFLKNSSLDERILISKIIDIQDAPEAMKQWAENPGKILKILVQF
ncbi:zinc-binding alcohol dehydrogenase family protein [Thermophagus sp. OGC60D27]|uniref:zinc-binding alcohol dehydrogenase family protein n=1 Tax=Thermophagus sp. OGC60D27 TaxID=3458415 RepID=UPI004038110E